MLCLIRHAEAVGNAQGRIMGATDLPLTPRGRAQAERLGRWLADSGVRFADVYASDLSRALATARALAEPCAAGRTPVVRAELREIGRGALEGATFEEAPELRADPAVTATFEPESDVAARIARVAAELRDASRHAVVCAVGHGGSLSRLVRRYLGLGDDGAQLAFENTGVTVLSFPPERPTVLHRFNAVCHLVDGAESR